MSNRARLGVVALAVIVVVVAFVALKPGDSSDKQDQPASRAADTTAGGGKTATSPKAGVPLAPPPPREITLKGGAPVGGVKSIKLTKGDAVALRVNTDETHDTLHLHGYDIEKDASASKPAVFKFTANIEGVFELESHTAEDAGREPLIAKLVVEPN